MAAASIPHRWTYNVFVSFRGEDIRKSFIDHLFKDFRQKGNHAFRDDSRLVRGEEICSQLYKSIEESRFLIVIFSKHYASSTWCLRELVKILECNQMRVHKHEVRVIFYDVKPDVVRKQTGSYAEAFAKHELSNRIEVAKWKEALCKATNLSGWDLQDMVNGYESKLIDSISKQILEKFCDGPLHVGENLVGLDTRSNKMNLSRFVGSNKVHMIGICGVGGIGKTTLAKAIYNLIYIHFEERIFLEDVQGSTKRNGLTHVVKKLVNDILKTTDLKICNIGEAIRLLKGSMESMHVLLVLDDIDHHDQLEALAGSSDWFFPGSLVIFTSKDRQLLAHKVDDIYDMEYLDDVESLELFSLYAFRQKHPAEGFIELSNQVVKYVQGHPLALKILGCFLYGETAHVWTRKLEHFQMYMNADIQQVLRLSFDGLDFIQQKVFLDIASYCVERIKDFDFAVSVLDSCNYFAWANIKVLVDRSLVTVSPTASLQMHNLIQRMAREIVREESNQVGNRSRLWIQSEVCDALSRNKVTEAVEVLVLTLEKSGKKVEIDCKSFTSMKNLRILIFRYLDLEMFDYTPGLNLLKESRVKFFGSLDFLSNELRLLDWQGFPFKFLPLEFYPENIVGIDLSYSHIKNLWTTPKCFNKLESMILKHCRYLNTTPDFTEITNLEILDLEGCVNLVECHPSIGKLKKLVSLNMIDCHSLRSFPSEVEMDSLKILQIFGCSKMDKWPKTFGTINTLTTLNVEVSSKNEIPSFLFSLCNLQQLSIFQGGGFWSRWFTSVYQPSHLLRTLLPPGSFVRCKKLIAVFRLSSLRRKLLPPRSIVLPSFSSLRFLRSIRVSYCNISEVKPNSFEGLSCLQHLDLSGNSFTCLPASLSQLSLLEILQIDDCEKLEALPELPPRVRELCASGCASLQKLQKLPILEDRYRSEVYLFGCQKLAEKHTIESLIKSMLFPHFQGNMHNGYCMFLPGNSIPQWFTHQSMGKHVTVELPPGWCYDKLRGYETCAVFTQKNFTEVELLTLTCSSQDNFDGDLLRRMPLLSVRYIFSYRCRRVVGSDMLWLCYSKYHTRWIKAKNSITFTFNCTDDYEIKECGVRLFCDEDIEKKTQSLPTPTQDDGAFHQNQERKMEDDPPFKKARRV